MIFEKVVQVLCSLLAWILNALPDVTLPAWFSISVQTLSDAIGVVGGLGQWIPIAAIGDVVTFILAAYAAAWAIRIGRILLSAFTGGGGGAA